ncbi:MAG TPA: hypothetical protein VIC87_09195 [Vicinamibacteria bacterium]|jgi:hypothetical protein
MTAKVRRFRHRLLHARQHEVTAVLLVAGLVLWILTQLLLSAPQAVAPYLAT